MQDLLQFKGIREGILVTVDLERDWPSIISDLTTRIDNQHGFFRGATLVLQLQNRMLQRADLERLVKLLSEREVTLAGVLTESAATQSAARQLNLAVDLNDVQQPTNNSTVGTTVEHPPAFPEKMFDNAMQGTEGVLVRKTLRSGRTVRDPGHVVVLGDVNPGAEVIAGGDIIIWGKARGIVHAGAMGDDTRVICALDLQPTQLRIASLISVSPPKNRRRKIRPEIASVRNGQIEAEEWSQ